MRAEKNAWCAGVHIVKVASSLTTDLYACLKLRTPVWLLLPQCLWGWSAAVDDVGVLSGV